MKQCGCNPIQEPFEFPILTNPENNLNIDNCCLNIDNLCELKKKIICDFYLIMDLLRCGVQPDLEFLLLEISLVYINNE